jgi:hypothetical protein
MLYFYWNPICRLEYHSIHEVIYKGMMAFIIKKMQRHLTISYDEQNEFFKIWAKDGEPVLSDHTSDVIKDNGWFFASDGHIGTHIIIFAPKDKKDYLIKLFDSDIIFY